MAQARASVAESGAEAMMSEEMQAKLNSALVYDAESILTAFRECEDEKEASKMELERKLALDESRVREVISEVNRKIEALMSVNKSPQYVYKKLHLVGDKIYAHLETYFESISEEYFSKKAN